MRCSLSVSSLTFVFRAPAIFATNDLAAFLSGYTEQEVGAATSAAIERENTISSALSAQSDTNDKEMVEAFCRYITGNSINGAPTTFVQNFLPAAEPYALKEYGYAYLGPDKKIAHELMPDISLMDVTTVDVKEIYDYMKTTGWLDSSTTKTVDTIVFAGEDAKNPVARSFWAAAEAAGPSVVTVTLVNAGAAKINVIKVIKEITGLGLKESKDIADNGGAIKEGISVDEANDIKAKLEEAGAEVEVK